VTGRDEGTETSDVNTSLTQAATSPETTSPETISRWTDAPNAITPEISPAAPSSAETTAPQPHLAAPHTPDPAPIAGGSPKPAAKKKGHGRNGVADFPAANDVILVHPTLSSRDPCPKCRLGTVYQSRPQILLRFTGQAPINAQIYHRHALRCDICGESYVAPLPPGMTEDKYDPTVVSMIGLLKYGRGMPFNRLDDLQADLGLPLPASTQWELVFGATQAFSPAYEELIRQAAQGEVVHNDDTTVKILELAKKRPASVSAAASPDAPPTADQPQPASDDQPSGERTGLFTTGIVSTLKDQQRIALFFSGRNHAGENLEKVLQKRAAELPPPIQMCDALSRNYPKDLQTIVSNCLAHGRRKFTDQHPRFPDECRYVLEQIEQVYIHDDHARTKGLSPEERLRYHQTHSQPILDRLHQWMKRQIAEKLVEHNSGLGGAINYLLKHWEKLTLFLRVAGAPLDNNIVERALKKAILHRKNALFYKTQRGADVGDMYMSLIFTCDLNDANPFEYLTELQRHAAQVEAAPDRWLPWNYRDTLENVRAGPAGDPLTPVGE
jgi:hypothetical protein